MISSFLKFVGFTVIVMPLLKVMFTAIVTAMVLLFGAVGLGLLDRDGRRQRPLDAKDLRDAVAKIRVDIDLCPGRCLEHKARAAQPPGHHAAWAHLGFGDGCGE